VSCLVEYSCEHQWRGQVGAGRCSSSSHGRCGAKPTWQPMVGGGVPHVEASIRMRRKLKRTHVTPVVLTRPRSRGPASHLPVHFLHRYKILSLHECNLSPHSAPAQSTIPPSNPANGPFLHIALSSAFIRFVLVCSALQSLYHVLHLYLRVYYGPQRTR